MIIISCQGNVDSIFASIYIFICIDIIIQNSLISLHCHPVRKEKYDRLHLTLACFMYELVLMYIFIMCLFERYISLSIYLFIILSIFVIYD